MSSIKNKIFAGLATVLSVGLLTSATFVPLPNEAYEVLNSKEAPISVSQVINEIGLESLDPHGDRFYITRDEAKDGEYYEANRMEITNNTIRISLDENLSDKYVQSATEAAELYQKLFDIINPNIKVEIGYFGNEDSNIIIKESEKDYGNALMSATIQKWTYHGETVRVNTPSNVKVYSLSDDKSNKENAFSFVHEFAHSIFGMNDYSKSWLNDEYHMAEPDSPKTIMNYNDIDDFKNVAKNPKFTVLDVAQAVAQWGLFSNNGIQGENPFESEEEYYAYIDSRLHEICYSREELILASDGRATYEGKVSINDYITLMQVNREAFSDGYDEREASPEEVVVLNSSEESAESLEADDFVQ